MTEDLIDQQNSDPRIAQLIKERFDRIDENLGIEELVETLSKEVMRVHTKDNKARIVSIVGGAASGKSTLARSIVAKLASRGVLADVIGTDDYVVGDREFRREHFEGKEPKAKYDFGLMNAKIEEIRGNIDPGQSVSIPTYNAKSGVAIAAGEEKYIHKVSKIDVLLVEGDFDEVNNPDLRLFVHVPDELRLENRVGRDVRERNEADEQKIRENFYQRQQTQHMPYTLPAAQSADLLIDAMLLEGVWRYDVYQVLDEPQNAEEVV